MQQQQIPLQHSAWGYDTDDLHLSSLGDDAFPYTRSVMGGAPGDDKQFADRLRNMSKGSYLQCHSLSHSLL